MTPTIVSDPAGPPRYVVWLGNRGVSCGPDRALAVRLSAALAAGFPFPSGGRHLHSDLSKAGL